MKDRETNAGGPEEAQTRRTEEEPGREKACGTRTEDAENDGLEKEQKAAKGAEGADAQGCQEDDPEADSQGGPETGKKKGFFSKKKDKKDEQIEELTDRLKRSMAEFDNYRMIGDIPSHERNAILKYCFGKGIRSYTTPKLSDVLIRSAESQHMFDTPLLLSRNTGLTIEQRLVKRAVDLALSFLALLPALPVMGLAALCIKAEDGGSVIYKQKRLTLNGNEFFVYKFRSMREDAEKDGVARLAGEKDERITKIGRVLRAARVDELPQLFNILKGDMSIVGPRPERPEIARQYADLDMLHAPS